MHYSGWGVGKVSEFVPRALVNALICTGRDCRNSLPVDIATHCSVKSKKNNDAGFFFPTLPSLCKYFVEKRRSCAFISVKAQLPLCKTWQLQYAQQKKETEKPPPVNRRQAELVAGDINAGEIFFPVRFSQRGAVRSRCTYVMCPCAQVARVKRTFS